mgnify:CR=1 FL=1
MRYRPLLVSSPARLMGCSISYDAVFPSADEYAHVSNVVLAALGLGAAVDEADENDDEQINDAKN